MDDFGSLLSDRMYAQQLHVLAPEQKFQKAAGVADNPSTRT
jgi:hypothetical protein